MGGGFKHYQNSAGLGRGKEGDIGKKKEAAEAESEKILTKEA